MIRLLLAVAATVTVVVFVMVNTHHVSLSFVVGGPIKVRLIFLLMLTFMLGALVTGFFGMLSKVRNRRRTRTESRQAQFADELD